MSVRTWGRGNIKRKKSSLFVVVETLVNLTENALLHIVEVAVEVVVGVAMLVVLEWQAAESG